MRGANAAIVAGLSGFAVMSVELAAVRLFAPYFGDSAYVWTNVIGVLLVALAIGAFLGGRAADAERAGPRLGGILVLAGLVTAVVPVVAGPLGAWLLPADLALDAAMPALVRGSLAATLLAFAPPVLLAGMATPMLVVAVVDRNAVPVGRAAGLVATWSTLGSLVGTFATTHLLVPGIGSRATVWLCAGLWILAGLTCRPGRWRNAALALPLGLVWLPLGDSRPVEAPARLLCELESPYQFLQVVEVEDAESGSRITTLKINEGLDSFHSVKLEGSAWTDGRYYDFHAAAAFLAGDGARPDELRVLSLGAAAGTFERIYRAAHPGCRIDSVELDPAVVDLGRRYFDAFGGEDVAVYAGLDARVFVERSPDQWHVVLVDAYERQIYVPAHVASREFFDAVRERLLPGGIVSVNVGGRTFDDPVVRAVARTMATVFGEAWAWRVPQSRNFVMLARRDRRIEPRVLADVRPASPELEAVLASMGSPAGWRRFEPGEPVLVDDRPFLDALQEQSLVRRLGDERPLTVDGDAGVEEVVGRAYELALAGDWEGVIGTAISAERATGYLRLLLGDARWRVHEVRGALAEWREAERVGVDEPMREALDERIADGTRAVEALDRAAEVASRNRWIAALGALLVLIVSVLIARRSGP